MKTIPLKQELAVPGMGGLVFPMTSTTQESPAFLLLQTPGLFHAEKHGGATNRGWDHFCLTAINEAAQVLWQIGNPWEGAQPYASHGAERSLCPFDLDGDGTDEIHVVRGSEVLAIHPHTGRILRAFPVPYDNFQMVKGGTIGPGPADRRLLASPGNPSYDPHTHGGPTLVFAPDGSVTFNRDIFGSGHDPLVLDIDEDGFDEWLLGYELLDQDMTPLWQFQPCPPDDYDEEMHVDGADILWAPDRQQRRIAFAASTFVYVLNHDGKLQWSHELVHPQHVFFGNFRTDRKLPQVFVLNKRDTLQLFDFHGNELWTRFPEENWPHGKPEDLTTKFHLFDPAHRLKNILPDGRDAICYLEGGWPYGIDGNGDRVLEFECPPSSRQPPGAAYRRPDDYGWGYMGCLTRIRERPHMIVSDRNHLWFFQLDA